jgi:hypothetical protein
MVVQAAMRSRHLRSHLKYDKPVFELIVILVPDMQLLFAQTCRPSMYRLLINGQTITPAEDTCYLLEFDDNAWLTTFKVTLTTHGYTSSVCK